MKVLCVLSRYAYGKPERGENYDYVHFLPAFRRLGHEVSFFDSGDRTLYKDFADLNLALAARVADWRPDMIFCVLMHYEIWSETLDLIRNQSPVVVVNWGTDDSWKFTQASRFFAEHVDLHVTTDLATAETAVSESLHNVILSQWAASPDASSKPYPSSACRYDVSFVGSIYGYRAEWVEVLRQSGVSVSCFGHRSENGVIDADEIPQVYRASRISLNFSGAGQNARGAKGSYNRQLKARTFEVPGAGGFLLTENAPGLERYFRVGQEVATFESTSDLIDKVRYYLVHPDERDAVARAGHERTMAEHTYDRRISEILKKLEPLRLGRTRPWAIVPDALAPMAELHRRKDFSSGLRPLLIAMFSLLFGIERGRRAARRFIYEVSWRLCGAATYAARGLPGRLFYIES
jgi:spore maturation protein CgeB